ncbi:hypothetical protein T484DRAFT_1844075 [Baffinella frigidus]|nr:hypothetical protein T484DRAFT_1844075 [Cryptophyta sp. CCMP2293]
MPGTPEGERDASCDGAGQHSPTLSDNDETKEEGGPSKARSQHHHPRQLTPARALEIYKLRPQLKNPGQLRRGAMVSCKAIAPQFGVSPKTVREIWAGRAWTRATRGEWTEADVAAHDSYFSRKMRDDPAASASNSSDVGQRTTNNEAVAPHPWSIPALQHSLQAPTLQAAPLLGLNNGTVPSLQALLAPQQAGLQQMQPAQHPSSVAQLLARFTGFQTAPPHTAWGSGAATQLVPTRDPGSTIRSGEAMLAQLHARQQQGQGFPQQQRQQAFLLHHHQQQQQQQQSHTLSPSGMLPTNLSFAQGVGALGQLKAPRAIEETAAVMGLPLSSSGMLSTGFHPQQAHGRGQQPPQGQGGGISSLPPAFLGSMPGLPPNLPSLGMSPAGTSVPQGDMAILPPAFLHLPPSMPLHFFLQQAVHCSFPQQQQQQQQQQHQQQQHQQRMGLPRS